MPARDGTGPLGQGPRTGRGAGFYAGFAGQGYMNAIRRGAAGIPAPRYAMVPYTGGVARRGYGGRMGGGRGLGRHRGRGLGRVGWGRGRFGW